MEKKMYYNYGGFLAEKVLLYDIDNNDLQILSFIEIFQSMPKTKFITVEEQNYYWITCEKILECNPTLRIQRRALETRISNLKNVGLLDKVVKCDDNGVKRTYYAVTSKFLEMRFSSLNNDENTELETVKKEEKEAEVCECNLVYKEIVDYLNSKSEKHFSSGSTKTKTLINARLKEGYTLEDFKYVIDIKCEEWKGTKMEQYLRPETLFSPKFEGYLNQKIINQNCNNSNPNALFDPYSTVPEINIGRKA